MVNSLLNKVQVFLRWKYAHFWRVNMGMNSPASIDDIKILYKSENFVAVDKHYDVKINSDDPKDTITVATQLAHLHPELVDSSLPHSFRFIHRLDYSTSGALCLALNKKAAANAGKMFKDRRVTKRYLALVRGHVTEDTMMIEKAIYPNPEEDLSHMMKVDDGECPTGTRLLSALTRLEVLQRGEYDSEPATKLLLQLHTGRRHQLRIHCQSIGHPIVGDYTYSMRKDVSPYRMMLLAHTLHIPIPGEDIDVTAEDVFTQDNDPKWIPYQEDR
ncbi:RNA pseudouridylate synthase domain-containing protein 1-like [Strongylocentrotus purpuratus]|uniref:Pseudouridine synthase RsuA/RluA-like domain-containing protein n=1 Tax=Strongylocentrotus purpuratus TaxID=7668 RepID=A0A7M7NSM7_STRPU|nr:RNA pseudouridylate synthase domain-containing protein 1-like [Strongylocentrotus purpuratus]XP_030840126.1 RNA pseudouridylate synthase domain-containing protein 1-like [Strongylocentrotus purpuratus]